MDGQDKRRRSMDGCDPNIGILRFESNPIGVASKASRRGPMDGCDMKTRIVW